MPVVVARVTPAPNDKNSVGRSDAGDAQGISPGSGRRGRTDRRQQFLQREKNIQACEAAGIDPVIAVARNEHHPDWREPAPLPENAIPVQAHRLKTQAGRALYVLRK